MTELPQNKLETGPALMLLTLSEKEAGMLRLALENMMLRLNGLTTKANYDPEYFTAREVQDFKAAYSELILVATKLPKRKGNSLYKRVRKSFATLTKRSRNRSPEHIVDVKEPTP